MGVADFEVVPKYVVERHLQPGDSRGLGLPIADGVEGFLTVERQPPHVVELGIDPGGDDLALSDGHRGLVDEFLVQPGQKRAARAQRFEIRQQRNFPCRRVGHPCTACSPRRTWPNSRGLMRPELALEVSRSRSPHVRGWSAIRGEGRFLRPTDRRLRAVGPSGQVGQRRHECPSKCPTTHGGARPVQNFHQEVPSSWFGCRISRLRTVNRSSHMPSLGRNLATP